MQHQVSEVELASLGCSVKETCGLTQNIWVLPWTNRCRAVEVHWELSVWEREPSRSCYTACQQLNPLMGNDSSRVPHTQTCICFTQYICKVMLIPYHPLTLTQTAFQLLALHRHSCWEIQTRSYQNVTVSINLKPCFQTRLSKCVSNGVMLLFVCWLDLDLLEWGSLWTYTRLMSHLQMLWGFELVFE